MDCTEKPKKSLIAFASLLACFALVMGLWGCSSQTNNTSDSQTNDPKQSALKVCFVEIVENDAFVTMINGFKQAMADEGYKNVSYDVKNAQGDSSTLNQIASQLKTSDYDVIVPIATPPAQACVNAGISKPMVFMSVTDPVAAGVTSSLEAPDKGMTGTTNTADVKAIFEFGKELKGDLYDKKVGIIYCSADKNSTVTAKQAKEYLATQGIEAVEKTVTNSSEVQQAAQTLSAECGSIYVPADSIVQVAMAQLTDVATKAGVAVLGTDPVMTDTGALESVSCTNSQLGQKSAKLAIRLLNGESVSDVPVYSLPSTDRSVNKATADALGITIDPDLDCRIVEN